MFCKKFSGLFYMHFTQLSTGIVVLLIQFEKLILELFERNWK